MMQGSRGQRGWRRLGSALATLFAAIVLAALTGCGDAGGPALTGDLRQLVAAGRFATGPGAAEPLELPAKPRLVAAHGAGQTRPAVALPLGAWSWRGTVPASARLVAGAFGVPRGGKGGPIEAWVVARCGPRQEVLARATGTGWLTLRADLAAFAGREVELRFSARPVVSAAPAAPAVALAAAPPLVPPAPVGSWDVPAGVVAWGPVAVVTRASAPPPRPNIVLIVVDTLRADQLGIYGNPRPTSPGIDETLASRGTVVERALSQAPWTLPSMTSMLTSRWPGDVLGEDPSGYGPPPGIDTLAVVLRQAGYDTGGFSGNPTIHAGNGFAQGFETFYTPEDFRTGLEQLHADDLAARAEGWLATRGARPFFLYAHFIDPHDPYENPDTLSGRCNYDPGYAGKLSGRFVHGVYLGKVPLGDVAADVRFLTALYDCEVGYVDRYVGELVRSLPPEVAANTLFVLTADHGEELHDHGGWKHGRTLYDEQLHVPLVVRWDGVVPAGRRLAGPLRLLDLAPTLAAAAGAPIPADWQGASMLGALEGRTAPTERPLFAQQLADGPVRAMAERDGWKLIVFDRNERFVPANEQEDILYRQELGRLHRIELYDLGADPHERHDLANGRPGRVRHLSPEIHQRLGQHLPGLRILLAGLPAGRQVSGSVTFERAPADWQSYFLADGDRVSLDGASLRFSWSGEAFEKGVRVWGDFGRIERVELDEPAVTPSGGAGRALPADGFERTAAQAPVWPGAPAGPALLFWEPVAAHGGPQTTTDPETLRRLQALGYVG